MKSTPRRGNPSVPDWYKAARRAEKTIGKLPSDPRFRRLIVEMEQNHGEALHAAARGDQSEFSRLAGASIGAAHRALDVAGPALPTEIRARLLQHGPRLQQMAHQLASPKAAVSHGGTPVRVDQAQPPSLQKPPTQATSRATADKFARADPRVDAAQLLEATEISTYLTPPESSPQEDILVLKRDMRRYRAQEFSQSSSVQKTGDTVQLNHPTMVRAMGIIQLGHGYDVEHRPFDVSYVSSTRLEHDMVVGTSVGRGSDAKRRPALVIIEDGQRLLAELEDLGRMASGDKDIVQADLAPNLFIAPREERSFSSAEVAALQAKLQLLCGPRIILSVAPIDERLCVLSGAVAGSSLANVSTRLPAHTRSGFARLALADLVVHYQQIEAHGFVHGDGNLDNTLIDFANEKVMAHGLIDAARLGAQGSTITPSRVEFCSPELGAASDATLPVEGITSAHDVWTLGISAIRLLAGDIAAIDTLRLPGALVLLRASLFVHLAGNDSTLLPLGEIERLSQRGDYEMSMVERMLQRDQTLAHFVLWRMLDPDPSRRATLAECAQTLAQLAQPLAGERHRIFAEVGEQTDSYTAAFAKLHAAADLLDGGISAPK